MIGGGGYKQAQRGAFILDALYKSSTDIPWGRAYRVMLIIVENGHSNPSSKPRKGCLHFTMLIHLEGMNPTIPSLAMGKQ